MCAAAPPSKRCGARGSGSTPPPSYSFVDALPRDHMSVALEIEIERCRLTS